MTEEKSKENLQHPQDYIDMRKRQLLKGKYVQNYFGATKRGNIIPSIFYPVIVSEDIRDVFKIITIRESMEIYIYNEENGGKYEERGKQTLREIISGMLGEYYLEKHATEVINHITTTTAKDLDSLTPPDYLVNVKNGIVDLRENPPKLLDHDPKYFFTTSLNADFDWKADYKFFEKFISELLPDDIFGQLQIQEGFGNSLTVSHEYMIFFFLFGGGRNGKSTLLRVLRQLLGKENCSSASITQLTYGRWYTATLFGKLINICGDIGIKELKHTGTVKVLSGEDSTFGERKYGHPFEFTNYAKPWVLGNLAPYVYDDTDAFHRRWNIIKFLQKFTKGAPGTNPKMFEKLTTPERLSGILNYSIEGYYRLHKQKNFTNLKTIEERRKQWKELSEPLLVFITDCVITGDSITKEDYFLSFKGYCELKGLPIISKSLVGRKMKELGYKEAYLSKPKKGKQQRSWIGITVRPEYLVEEDEEPEQHKDLTEESWKEVLKNAGEGTER